jgi:hypothetical protein
MSSWKKNYSMDPDISKRRISKRVYVEFVWEHKEAKIGNHPVNSKMLIGISMDPATTKTNMAKVRDLILAMEREKLCGQMLRGHEIDRIREKRKHLYEGSSLVALRNLKREKRRVAIESQIREGQAPPRWYDWTNNLKDPIPSVAKQSWIQARKIANLSKN